MFNYIVKSYGRMDIHAVALDDRSMYEFSTTNHRYGFSIPDISEYCEAVNRGSCELSVNTGKFIFYYNNQTWCWLQAANCYDAVSEFRKIVHGKREDFKSVLIQKFGPVTIE